MFFALFLFVQGSFSGDAYACINGMDEDKKVDVDSTPKSRKVPKGEKKKPQKKDSLTAETKSVETSKSIPVQKKPEVPSQPKTQTEKATVSSCSSFGLVNSLWMFALTLPFLARFREN